MGQNRVRRARFTKVDAQRLWSRAIKLSGDDGCWGYYGQHDSYGYGVFCFARVQAKAHRVAWRIKTGRWPKLEIHHMCRNKGCINPRHLQEVTRLQHWHLDRKNPETCRRGHTLAGRKRRNGLTVRYCRDCERMRSRAYHARHRDRINARKRAKRAVEIVPDGS